MCRPKNWIFILLVFLQFKAWCNSPDSSILYKNRRTLCYGVGIGMTVATHTALWQVWYKDYPKSSFHFINDNKEWNQMDKFGHVFSSYYLSYTGIEMAKYAGMNSRQAAIRGGMLGIIFQYPLEIFDGFSAGWGASIGDLVANTSGSALAIGQQLAWDEQKVRIKFSFQQSSYAHVRPNTLGDGYHQEFLKDYNGQTYWLSAGPNSFGAKKWPAWLNLAVGFGADGLLGGFKNEWIDKKGNFISRIDVKRSRQYYLSLDLDLTKIKTKSKALKTFFIMANCIKFPLPSFEINSFGNTRFHLLGF